MPIYEYESMDPDKGCTKCLGGFEILQHMDDEPLSRCPECGQAIRKIISWCRAAVTEASEDHIRVERRIDEYEKQGMWSHAAELADKHSEKIKDQKMRMRAIDNYAKAGYETKTLEKHAKEKL